GQQIAQLQGQANSLKCLGPQHPFAKHGQSGQEISAVFPHTAKIADDLCIVRSMVTEQINHDPAHTFMNTGGRVPGRPSMGSWLLYGLGSECEDLPGFIVLTSAGGGQGQPIAARQWHSGFLPSKFQGVPFHAAGDPVHYVAKPPGISMEGQEGVVRAIQRLHAAENEAIDDPELATRISQYEMAFRMHMSVPELVDFKGEPKHVLDLYGPDVEKPGTFAANCLQARRLAERGVRFIQLYHPGWDNHSKLPQNLPRLASEVDQPCAGLIRDLKLRGMLEDTLVIWGGEFGRTSYSQGTLTKETYGRDHHPRCF
ncbi:MAG: DUF1501 domain-containing protein, partial [Verrucomicrobiae bacterium]|nr:DUF1501 domain-containing protein [Verrucomicrobiae bacterium]